MKLKDLNARFLSHNGEGKCFVGVEFDCPCGHPRCANLFVPFKQPLGERVEPYPYAEKGWDRTGEAIETLTLRPSVQRVKVDPTEDGDGWHICAWHGYITNGEAKSC